jgi:putative Ca2+/H+ antiporter (TMEM165/GDT1 family)
MQASSSSLPVLNHEETQPSTLLTSSEGTLLLEDSETVDVTAAPESANQSQNSFWKIFSSTFITIFLAEIGDKTQVSTLLMSAEFHQPWVVFAGAGTALVATTLIGVWVGQWLSSRLSPRTLDIAAGILLALISLSLIWDVVMM